MSIPADASGTGFGNIVRDSTGVVIGDFCSHLGNRYDPIVAESLALREGLLFAKTRGIIVDIVESDCQPLMTTIGSQDPPLSIEPIISNIRTILLEAGVVASAIRWLPPSPTLLLLTPTMFIGYLSTCLVLNML